MPCQALFCSMLCSSRRRHTIFDCDWSSDVCSSDLSRWQISTDGGQSPIWNPAGDEVFYRRGKAVMTVPLETSGGTFKYGNARTLFAGSYVEEDPQRTGRSYAVASDGQRFLMMKESARPPMRIIVVRNWAAEVDRRLAVR